MPLFAAVSVNSTLPLITSAVASFIKLYLLLLFVRVLLTWFPNVDWMGQPWVTLRQACPQLCPLPPSARHSASPACRGASGCAAAPCARRYARSRVCRPPAAMLAGLIRCAAPHRRLRTRI